MGSPVEILAPPCSVEPERDTGTKFERSCGWPCNQVGQKPRRDAEVKPSGLAKSSGVDGQEKLSGKLYGDRTGNRHRWVRREASGERVRRGQGTRHTDPVTSEEGMPGEVRPSRSKLFLVAVNRPKRLFSKNTGVCQAA